MTELLERKEKLNYNLMSFYYIKTEEDYNFATILRDRSKEVIIDSGAHSFQKGTRVNWQDYTEKYAEFIRKFDRPNVVGYFEMDVDNILGYEEVLRLRQILENVSDKIIPVWHKNRGIEEYKQMCQKYHDRVVAITGFKNEDIKDDQYLMFVKYAKKYNCKIHCLGMTRKEILNKVPFDYVDSSSWVQYVIYGRTLKGDKLPKQVGYRKKDQFKLNYELAMEMQDHYYQKWKRVCKD